MKVHNPNKLPTAPISDLLPSQGDLKDLTEKNYKKLKNTIERRGFSVPVYVWEDKQGVKHLLDGHQRQRVLTTEGWNEPIPYLLVPAENLQEAMARLLEITSQYATITQEGIDEFIAKYELNEAEVYEATSFDALTNYATDEPEKEVEEDEAPEVDESEPPKSKLGEIYQLGRHRVMCGDSTDFGSVTDLMNGAVADMVFTDPPYGVDYSGRGKKTNNKIENDALSIEDTEIMVSKALSNAFEVSREGTTCFVWHADSKPELRPLFERSFIGAGFRLAATIIWLKKQASMGYQDYRSQHEPCLYGWKGKKQDRVKDRTQTTVWESGRDSNYEHPTQKPVFLAATAIANHNPGIVLDLFLGSGSTLIACEQTDRTCYGMELDPKYVDVIRKRYAKFIQPDDQLPENWEELTPAINSVDKP